MSKISGDKQAHSFKTFPEFSKLTLADRKYYEKLIASYPPVSDLSFATLMIWWNWLDSCAVSMLNGNLVISYWFPEIEKFSGLSIVGTNKIDESICTIFDYLRDRKRPVELVHVPEFVMANMEYPEMFDSKEERGFDEYIFPVSKFYPLSHTISYRRRRVRKFIAETDESRTMIKSLDLSDEVNRQILLSAAAAWQRKGFINNIAKVEADAMHIAITQADVLGIENACLYIDGEFHGFCLYQLPADKRYIIFNHARVNYDIPRTLDYMVYAFARWLADQGTAYVNLESDLGLPLIRMFKLALGPTNYFRKYTVRPSGEQA